MKVVGLQTHIWSNNLKSLYLLLIFPVILCVLGLMLLFAFNLYTADEEAPVGYEYIDRNGRITYEPVYEDVDPFQKTLDAAPVVAPFFFVGVGIWFLIAWLFNRQMIGALTQSEPLKREDNPRVYNIVENLCISRGLPVPKIYIIHDSSLNAFASGLSPRDAMIGFTSGILEKLDDAELEAVAAHELAHIMNYDTRLMLVAIIFVGIIQTMAEVFMRMRFHSNSDSGRKGAGIIFLLQILAMILGFLITALVQAAISRRREYLADAGSVELVKTSDPLVRALTKISADSQVEAVNNHNVAQMFIYHPLNKQGLFGLFATHPPLEERVAALKAIG